MQALRVLHVVPYYERAWAYGGIPRVTTAQARGLARRGHDVTVCTTDAGDARARASRDRTTSSERDGVEVRVFPNVSNALAYHLQLFLPWGLGAYLRRHVRTFDVAHLHGCHHLPGAIAARHLRRAGVPYVVSPHGTAPRLERRRAAKWIFDTTLGRGVIEGAALLIAVTDAERRQLEGLDVSSRSIRIVPDPIDLSEFDPPPERGRFRDRLGLDGRPMVLFLGKLTPRKRVDVLVKAFASLRRQEPVLVVAGNDLGAGRGVRKLARRLGLGERARFTGLLAGRARLEALVDADVVVYASSDEIFGLVPLEALLSSVPVIVGDDSGCGEVIRMTGGGSTVPPGDPEALTDALGRMLDELPRWRRAAQDARPRVAASFAADRACAGLERIYREVLGPVVVETFAAGARERR